MKFKIKGNYEGKISEICWEDGEFSGTKDAVDWMLGIQRALSKQGLAYNLEDEISAYHFCNHCVGPIIILSSPYEGFPFERRQNPRKESS